MELQLPRRYIPPIDRHRTNIRRPSRDVHTSTNYSQKGHVAFQVPSRHSDPEMKPMVTQQSGHFSCSRAHDRARSPTKRRELRKSEPGERHASASLHFLDVHQIVYAVNIDSTRTPLSCQSKLVQAVLTLHLKEKREKESTRQAADAALPSALRPSNLAPQHSQPLDAFLYSSSH
jgi:hypothetical protein